MWARAGLDARAHYGVLHDKVEKSIWQCRHLEIQPHHQPDPSLPVVEELAGPDGMGGGSGGVEWDGVGR